MVNLKYYFNDLLDITELANIAVSKKTGRPCLCNHLYCDECKFDRSYCHASILEWLLSEHEGSEVDWGSVPVDTPILVWNIGTKPTHRRHFAKYENGKVYAWVDGATSWTSEEAIDWDCAKLVKEE